MFLAAVAAAVYTTVLQNGISKWTARLVPAAAIKAGLPQSDVGTLMQTIADPTLLAKNYSPKIVAAVGGALQAATQHGIQ